MAKPTYEDLVDLLRDVADVLDNYSDVSDGDYGQPRPNMAMQAHGEVERMLDRIDS